MARTGGGDELSVPESIPTAERIDADFDDFIEETAIGSGGNADVYRMRYPGPGPDTVAVKQPRLAGTVDTSEFDQFITEAETWSKLDDHDHIVGVLDWGSEPLPWIALEYMDGGGLDERLAEISVAESLWTGVCICRAVRHAHRRGVAHLDLKPKNVLFRETPGDAFDVPKVSDWGLAKMLLEHSGSIEGLSPHYAAPEQFGEGSPDDFTDIYQTGAVVYAALTGRPLFEGSAHSVMGDVLSTEPTPPSEIADVPPVVDEPILTALSKEKSDRQESILDLRRELEACLEDLEGNPTADGSSSAPSSDPDPDPDPALGLDLDLETGSDSDSDSAPSARAATGTQPDSAGGTTGTASGAEPTPAGGRPDESDAAEAGSPGVGRTADAARSESASHEPTATDPASDVGTRADAGSDTSSVADPGNWHYAVAGTIGLMALGAGVGIDAFAVIGFFAFFYAYNRDLKELAGADIEWQPRRWLWLPGLIMYPITLPYYFYKRWRETTSNSG